MAGPLPWPVSQVPVPSNPYSIPPASVGPVMLPVSGIQFTGPDKQWLINALTTGGTFNGVIQGVTVDARFSNDDVMLLVDDQQQVPYFVRAGTCKTFNVQPFPTGKLIIGMASLLSGATGGVGTFVYPVPNMVDLFLYNYPVIESEERLRIDPEDVLDKQNTFTVPFFLSNAANISVAGIAANAAMGNYDVLVERIKVACGGSYNILFTPDNITGLTALAPTWKNRNFSNWKVGGFNMIFANQGKQAAGVTVGDRVYQMQGLNIVVNTELEDHDFTKSPFVLKRQTGGVFETLVVEATVAAVPLVGYFECRIVPRFNLG